MAAARRIQKEFQEFHKDCAILSAAPGGPAIEPPQSDIPAFEPSLTADGFNWKVQFNGPKGTAYGDFQITIDVKFPPDYPFKPATFLFPAGLWHPMVTKDSGAVCADELGMGATWGPARKIAHVCADLYAKFSMSVPLEGPLNDSALVEYKESPDKFKATAVAWASKHLQPRGTKGGAAQ